MSSPVVEELLDRLRSLWASTPVSVPAASAAVLGGVKLKGDLGGSAESPTVPGLAGKAAVAHTHPVAQVDGLSPVLAGKADLVGGKVPPDQLPAIPVSKADVGLGNVDNTSDASKPVSTLQAAALAGKAPIVHAHTVADVTGLQPVLDGKAPAVIEYTTVHGWPGEISVEGLAEDSSRQSSRKSLLVGYGPPVEGDGVTPPHPIGQVADDGYLDVGTLKLYKLEAGG